MRKNKFIKVKVTLTSLTPKIIIGKKAFKKLKAKLIQKIKATIKATSMKRSIEWIDLIKRAME